MKRYKTGIIIFLCIITPTIWMTINVLKDVEVTCKVCMTFKDKQNCGRSEAKHKDDCISTAKDNACALIASGMDASIQCSQKTADSVEVEAKQ